MKYIGAGCEKCFDEAYSELWKKVNPAVCANDSGDKESATHNTYLVATIFNIVTFDIVPSILENQLPILKFGCLYFPGMNMREVVITMADREWIVSVYNQHLDAATFDAFVAALDLNYLDYLFIAVSALGRLFLVVLDAGIFGWHW